jgi:hypothetical protein
MDLPGQDMCVLSAPNASHIFRLCSRKSVRDLPKITTLACLMPSPSERCENSKARPLEPLHRYFAIKYRGLVFRVNRTSKQ